MSEKEIILQLKDAKILDENNQFTELGCRLLMLAALQIANDAFNIIFKLMERDKDE